ncbi:MAG: hypothetical protein IKP58_17170 [Victivallales bacterium]|nr:hypothetical protein [Victivallales bacterium]
MFAVRYPERVLKILGIFGAIDVADMANRNAAFKPVIDGLYPNDEVKTAISPLNHGKAFVQFHVRIYHGDKDEAVPLSYSMKMEVCLKKNGGKVELVIVSGMGHDNAIFKNISDDLIEFLK